MAICMQHVTSTLAVQCVQSLLQPHEESIPFTSAACLFASLRPSTSSSMLAQVYCKHLSDHITLLQIGCWNLFPVIFHISKTPDSSLHNRSSVNGRSWRNRQPIHHITHTTRPAYSAPGFLPHDTMLLSYRKKTHLIHRETRSISTTANVNAPASRQPDGLKLSCCCALQLAASC